MGPRGPTKTPTAALKLRGSTLVEKRSGERLPGKYHPLEPKFIESLREAIFTLIDAAFAQRRLEGRKS